MPPVRVGIVGLSANSSGASWAKLTHLPYLQASPHYEVTGVLNSSLASSETAIEDLGLSGSVKPYGDIDSMASNPDIDLIVVCCAVNIHAEFVKGSIKHGKRVYCEWPLGKNYEEANELSRLAEEKGIKTYCGLESRLSPVTSKLRELTSSGVIGNVTSTDAIGSLGPAPTAWTSRIMTYLDIHSGQSPLHTRFGHFLDAFCFTVGEFESFTPLLATHNTDVKVYDVPVSGVAEAAANPQAAFKIVKRTSPDEILLQGRLQSGAVASIHLRSGDNDADGNSFHWLITGTKGLIELTQKVGQPVRDKSASIKLVKGGKVTNVELDWDTEGEFKIFGDHVVLTTPGRNYKAIAEDNEGAIINFAHAAKRHKMIDHIIEEGLVKQ